MDKLTEKYLRRVISESYISDVEEMAYKQKGVTDDKGKLVKYKPFFKEDNDTDIPDYWIANPTLQEGGEILVVPLDCQELEEFKKPVTKKGIMSKLDKLKHDDTIGSDDCKEAKQFVLNFKI